MTQRRNIFHALYAILAVVLCSVHVVESKKEKKTKAPSSSPSSAPSTSFPSAFPSAAPTRWPSNTPTTNPTLRPSASPTELPTPAPTQHPTDKPTAPPTHKPTSTPTLIPTLNPSQSPSLRASTNHPTNEVTSKSDPTQFPSRGTPTANPTEELVITPSPTNQPSKPSNVRYIPVPRIQIALILSDSSTAATRDNIQKHMSSFITVLFETKSGIEALDMKALELEIVPSTFVKQTVESGFSVKIEGMLQNTHGNVTKEIVQKKVVEYFSSVGISDLETFLHGKSITSASVGELYVDGIVVFMRGDDGKTSAKTRQKSGRPKRGGLFALLAGASGVLMVSCSIFFYRRNYDNESGSGSGSSAQQHQSLLAKLRQNGSTSEQQTDNESQNSGRDISVHVSMDELEPVDLHRVDSYREYDATRLDRIISDAKKSHHDGKKKGRRSNAFLGSM